MHGIESFMKAVEQMEEKTVIVEGKKDEKALKALGINNIIPINGKPLAELITVLGGKDVVILTDFDREGKRIAARLMKLLHAYGINTNPKLRSDIMGFGKNHIEEFHPERMMNRAEHGKTKEGDTHGKVGADFNQVCNKGSCKSKRRDRKTRCDWSYIWPDRGFAGF